MVKFPCCRGHPVWQRGAMAQLVARLVRNEKVRGSNPLSSTHTKCPLSRRNTASQRNSLRCHFDSASPCAPHVRPRPFKRSKPARSAAVPKWCRYRLVVAIDACPIHA